MNSSSQFLSNIEFPKNTMTKAKGHWFNIRLRPNPFSGDVLNVGVGFVDHSNDVHIKVANDLSKLSCLYGDKVDIGSMQDLIDMTVSAINKKRFVDISPKEISPQISFSGTSYAAGTTIEKILDTFFENTVALSGQVKSRKKEKKTKRSGLSDDNVSNGVRQWMYKYNSELASQIFPSNPLFTVNLKDGNKESIRLPIRSQGRFAGNIVSAFSSESTAQLRLLQSSVSMQTVRRYLPNENLGMFVLRPGKHDGLSDREMCKFDRVIDENVWQLQDAGVHVGVEYSIESLGQEIASWAT